MKTSSQALLDKCRTDLKELISATEITDTYHRTNAITEAEFDGDVVMTSERRKILDGFHILHENYHRLLQEFAMLEKDTVPKLFEIVAMAKSIQKIF